MAVRLWLPALLCGVVAAQVWGCCGDPGDDLTSNARSGGRWGFRNGTMDRPSNERRGGQRWKRLRIPLHLYKQIQEGDLSTLLGSIRGARHPAFVSFSVGTNASRPGGTGLLGAGRPTVGGGSTLQMDLQEVALERRNVIKDAACKPRKVPVGLPPPEDPLVLYTPACVLIPRCSGCCGHELLQCVPTEVKTIRKKVLALRFSEEDHLSLADQESSVKRVKVDKHVKCECQCKVKESNCTARQVYDAANCRCLCPNEHEASSCPGTKIWSETDCMCKCARVDECSTGLDFDPVQCRCLPSRSYRPTLLFSAGAPAQGVPSDPAASVGTPATSGTSGTSGGSSSAGWGSAMSSGVIVDRPPPSRTRPQRPSQTYSSYSRQQTSTPYPDRRYGQQGAPTPYPDRRYGQEVTPTSYPDRRYGQQVTSTPYADRRYGQQGTPAPYPDRRYDRQGTPAPYDDRRSRQRQRSLYYAEQDRRG